MVTSWRSDPATPTVSPAAICSTPAFPTRLTVSSPTSSHPGATPTCWSGTEEPHSPHACSTASKTGRHSVPGPSKHSTIWSQASTSTPPGLSPDSVRYSGRPGLQTRRDASSSGRRRAFRTRNGDSVCGTPWSPALLPHALSSRASTTRRGVACRRLFESRQEAAFFNRLLCERLPPSAVRPLLRRAASSSRLRQRLHSHWAPSRLKSVLARAAMARFSAARLGHRDRACHARPVTASGVPTGPVSDEPPGPIVEGSAHRLSVDTVIGGDHVRVGTRQG